MADKSDKNFKEKDTIETAYPLSQHLTELRKRLIYIAVCLILVFCVVYWRSKFFMELLYQPVEPFLPEGSHLTMLKITEAFITELKLCAIVSVMFSTPFLLYQLWSFIAPGLYAQERKYIFGFVFFASLLFFGGASFAYFVVFPFGFKFFLAYASGDVLVATLSIDWYFSFVIKFLLAFGLVFELPVVVFFLAKIGLVTDKMLRKYRGIAVVAIFILAAILTPPDIISQTSMAIPLLILYELSIWIAKIFGKKPQTSTEVAIYE